MKWIMGFTIFFGVGFVIILIIAIMDGKRKPSKPVEEHSPENLDDIDRTLKRLSLRNKLKKIEEERD